MDATLYTGLTSGLKVYNSEVNVFLSAGNFSLHVSTSSVLKMYIMKHFLFYTSKLCHYCTPFACLFKGDDFRKDYSHLSMLCAIFPNVPVVALTATARTTLAALRNPST